MEKEQYPSYVLDLLQVIDDQEQFAEKLEKINPFDLVVTQDCLWTYAMRFSRENGVQLTRNDITSRMEDTASYQYRIGCDEPIDYCRANICVNTNPNCAGDKLKNSIRVLKQVIVEIKNK